MKTKDYFKKLLGQPTSEELRRQAKAASKAEKQATKHQQRAEAKDQQRRAVASAEEERLQAEQRLVQQYEAEAAKPGFDARIPHPTINFNQRATTSYPDYYRLFVSDFVLKYLPRLLEIADFKPEQAEFNLFDYGCGLGRFAFAFTNYFGKQMNRRYVGYEVHPAATAFFQKAYADYPNAQFFGDAINIQDSYVEIHEGNKPGDDAEHRIDAAKVNLRDRVGVRMDLQFSGSVFTHMYRSAIVHVLKEFSAMMKPGGVCVNTWLIVDELAEASLRCGLADRALPFESLEDGFLYYLEDNPLMCSAYRLEAMKSIYAEAGHEILDIRWGKWSGRLATQDFSWQDVVISRPLPSPR